MATVKMVRLISNEEIICKVTENDDNTITIANTVDFDDFTGDSRPPVYYGLHAFPSGAVVEIHRIQKGSYPISFERRRAKEDQREPFHT